MNAGLRLQILRRDLSNFSLLRRRDFDGHLVSMHQSGTHWLKYMLAMLICEGFEIPPPSHIGDNSVVGHPRDVPKHGGPIIVHSHSIPSPLVHAWLFRQILRFPRYVLLIRDMRAALVSHFEKWKSRYGVSFSEYLRGDVGGRRFDKDIWWDIRFLNAWSAVRKRLPGGVLLLHYETLKEDPESELRRIWEFFDLPAVDKDAFRRAVHRSGKEQMSARENPGEELKVVRRASAQPFAWYDESDRAFLINTCRRFLRDALGYDYTDWTG